MPFSFEGLMRASGIPNLPTDKFKIAVENWCFTVVISADKKVSIVMKDLWNEKLPIEHLRTMLKLLSWGGQEVSVKITGNDILALNFRGRSLSAGNEGSFSEMSNITEMLQEIHLCAGHTDVSLSFTDLYSCFSELSFVNKILTAQSVEFKAGWDSIEMYSRECSQILAHFHFQVCDLVYFILLDASVDDKSSEEVGIWLDCGKRILKDCFIGNDSESVKSAGRQSYQLEADRRGDECLFLGDLRDVLEK